MNICLLYFRRIGFQRRYAQYYCYTITINVMFFFNSYQTNNSRIQLSLHYSKESILWFWGSSVQLKFQFSRVMTNQKKRNYALHSYLVTWTHCSVFINVVWLWLVQYYSIILLSLSISLKRRKLFNMMKANLIGKFSGHAQYIPYLKMVIMIMILIIDNNTDRISGIHGLQIALSYYTKNFAL